MRFILILSFLFLSNLSFADAFSVARIHILRASYYWSNYELLTNDVDVWNSSRNEDPKVNAKLIEILSWTYHPISKKAAVQLLKLKQKAAECLKTQSPPSFNIVYRLAHSHDTTNDDMHIDALYDIDEYPAIADVLAAWASNEDESLRETSDMALSELVRALESNERVKIIEAERVLFGILKSKGTSWFEERPAIKLRIEKALNRPWVFKILRDIHTTHLFSLDTDNLNTVDKLRAHYEGSETPLFALMQSIDTLIKLADDKQAVELRDTVSEQIKLTYEQYPELRKDWIFADIVLEAIVQLRLHDNYFDALLADFLNLKFYKPKGASHIDDLLNWQHLNDLKRNVLRAVSRIQDRYNTKESIRKIKERGREAMLSIFHAEESPIAIDENANNFNEESLVKVITSVHCDLEFKLELIDINILKYSQVVDILIKSLGESDDPQKETKILNLLQKAELNSLQLTRLQNILSIYDVDYKHIIPQHQKLGEKLAAHSQVFFLKRIASNCKLRLANSNFAKYLIRK